MVTVSPPRPAVSERLARIDDETFLERVSTDKMFTAPYSRPLSTAQLGRMAREGYSARKAGIITLSMRGDGRFAVVDGNHRRHLAAASGVREMLSRVFIDLSYAEEAELFEALNTIKPPTAIDRFKSRLERGERVALDIRDRLAVHGLHVSIVSGRDSRGALQSVHELERLYDELGPEAFSHVLLIVFTAWEYDTSAWTSRMLAGMRQFWARYGDVVDAKDLVRRLQQYLPSRLLAAAGASPVRSESVGTLVGKHLQAVYNARRRSNLLPEWKPRVAVADLPQHVADRKRGAATVRRATQQRGPRRP